VHGTNEDAIFEAAMDAGADDIQPHTADDDDGAAPAAAASEGSSFKVYTAVEDFGSAAAALKGAGFNVDAEACELVYIPAAEVEVDDDAFAK
jgi:transcriptional/translational regulatory protein YebC/TACO1